MRRRRLDADEVIQNILHKTNHNEPLTPAEIVVLIGKFPNNIPDNIISQCRGHYEQLVAGKPVDRDTNRVLDAMWDILIKEQIASIDEGNDGSSLGLPNIAMAIRSAKAATGIHAEDPTIRTAWLTDCNLAKVGEVSTRASRQLETLGDGEEAALSDLERLQLPDTARGRRALRRAFPPPVPFKGKQPSS